MKKSVLCILVLAMIFILSACSKSENTQNTETTPVATKQETAPEPTKKITAEPTEEATPEPTAEPTEEATPEPTAEPTEEATPEPTAEPSEEPTSEPEPDYDSEVEVDALGNASFVQYIDKSDMRAELVGYYEFIGDNYIAILNFYDQFLLDIDVISSLKAGDTLELNGAKTIVKGFYTMDEDHDFSIQNDTFVEGSRMVVIPENPEELFPKSQMNDMGYDEDPEYYAIGFVSFFGEETYAAYTDWAWDDCYVPATYVSLPMVKLVVTPETTVRLAYNRTEDYELVMLSGPDYLKLWDNKETQKERDIYIDPSTEVYVTEILDDTGRSTGEISRIEEIYTP